MDEAKGEIIIYKGSLEEQKRRNIQLETEIRQLEKGFKKIKFKNNIYLKNVSELKIFLKNGEIKKKNKN